MENSIIILSLSDKNLDLPCFYLFSFTCHHPHEHSRLSLNLKFDIKFDMKSDIKFEILKRFIQVLPI